MEEAACEGRLIAWLSNEDIATPLFVSVVRLGRLPQSSVADPGGGAALIDDRPVTCVSQVKPQSYCGGRVHSTLGYLGVLDHALAYAPLDAECGRAECTVRPLQATRRARLLA